MKSIEETVIVSAPVGAAYELWEHFEPIPAFMSGSQSSLAFADAGGRPGPEADPGPDTPALRIAWRSIEGESHTGAIVFTPLDPETTRILARIQWPEETNAYKTDTDRSATGAKVRETLRRYAEFVESQ